MTRRMIVASAWMLALVGCVAAGSAALASRTLLVDPAAKSEFKASKMRFSGETDKSPVEYAVGEKMKFTFRLNLNQPAPSNKVFFVKWSRRGDDGVSFTGLDRITEEKPVSVSTSIDRPGFVNVGATLVDVSGNGYAYFQDDYNRVPLTWEGSAGAAVDRILPSYAEPADFDAFWARQLAELAKVPVKAKLVDVPADLVSAKYRDTHVVRTFAVDCLGPRPVTGFVALPRNAAARSLPVRITFDGYGEGSKGHPPAEWLCSPWPVPSIKMHVNAHGYELLKDDAYYKKFFADKGGYGFSCPENEKPETSYFLPMALRVVRAFDWAKTLPEWNGKDLVATGGSQGGLQTTWAASLVKGLSLAEPSVTWICDAAGPTIGRLPGWRPDYRAGLGYFDSAFHSRRIPDTCQLNISRAGLGDYVCPPSGLACQYNLANCPKRIVWWQNSTHMYVTPISIRHCWTNEAPAGAGVSGVAPGVGTTRAITPVKAAFDPKGWTIRTKGGAPKSFDFAKRADLRKAAASRGRAPVLTDVEIRGTLVAEADGEVALGAGLDWWWTCTVNGKDVFGRTKVNGANNTGSFEKTDWIFAAPVKKGANEVVFAVRLGESGFGEVGVIDGVREVDAAPAQDYVRCMAAFRDPASVPFAPRWTDATHVSFRTAQAAPAGIEYRRRGEKTWKQAWDLAFAEKHCVELPDPSFDGNFEYRKVEWADVGGWNILRDEKDVRKTALDHGKMSFDCWTDRNPLTYRPGETMKFLYRVKLNQNDPCRRQLFLRWTRSGDDGLFRVGVEPIADGRTITVPTSIDCPGFVRMQADVCDAAGHTLTWFAGDTNHSLAYDSGAGAAPDTLLPACEEPADYGTFWKARLGELAKVPVKPELVELPTNRIPEKFRGAFGVWAVSVPCLGPRPCTGFLIVPKDAAAKSLPAQCAFDGYGPGCQDGVPGAWDYEQAQGKIHFHINAHGYDLLKDKDYYKKYMAERPNYGLNDAENDRPETAYFFGMAMRVVRAFDFVKTLPEWNGKDLKARGGSQGGLQTTWAGDLVEGLTECEPWVTWCTDIAGGEVGRLTGWRPTYRPGLAYYDTVIHTRHIPSTCHLFISRAGLGDYICPPSGLACQWNAASCPKKIVWVQSSTHGFQPPMDVRHAYTNEAPAGAALVKGRAARPEILRKGGFVKAKLEGIAPSAQLRLKGGPDGKDLPVKAKIQLKAKLVAEADGEAILGAGFDWWWECSVNGRTVFGRPEENPSGNGTWPVTARDWVFTAPVRKGENEVIFDVVLGEHGLGGAVALDPAEFPQGVDVRPVRAYRDVKANFPYARAIGPYRVAYRAGAWKFTANR